MSSSQEADAWSEIDTISSCCCTPNSSSSTSNNAIFRSILPHEPPYTDDNNAAITEKGYVLIQGLLVPKIKSSSSTRNKQSSISITKDNNNCWDVSWIRQQLLQYFSSSTTTNLLPYSCTDVVIVVVTTTTTEDSTSTNSSTAAANHNSTTTASSSSSTSSANRNTRRDAPTTNRTVSSSTTITRARIEYTTEWEARELFRFLRHYQISPNDIFHRNNNNTNNHYEYSTKPFQVSHVTMRPISSFCWPFASPPKFRRLLLTPPSSQLEVDGMDTVNHQQQQQNQQELVEHRREHIEHIKASTRYLYLSGIEPAIAKLRSRLSPTNSRTTSSSSSTTSSSSVITPMIMIDAIRTYIIQSLQLLHNNSSYPNSTSTNMDTFVEVWIPNSHPSISSTSVTTTATAAATPPSTTIAIPKKQQPIKYCYIGVSHHSIASNLVQQLLGKKAVLVFTIPSWLLNDNNNNTDNNTNNNDPCTSSTTTSTVETQQPFIVLSAETDPLFLDWADASRREYSKDKKNKKEERHATNNNATKPDCTSTTSSVHIPGLFVLPNFLSKEEEHILCSHLTGPYAPWAPSQKTPTTLHGTGSLKRRVQHYGYVFDYASATVVEAGDATTTISCCPPLPAVSVHDEHSIQRVLQESVTKLRGWDIFAGILERARRMELIHKNDDPQEQAVAADDNHVEEALPIQNGSLTVAKSVTSSGSKLLLHHGNNYYTECGAGNSDLSMPTSCLTEEFTSTGRHIFKDINQVTVNEYIPGIGIGSHIDTESAFADGILSISLKSGCTMEFREQCNDRQGQRQRGRRKLVYLPPRSLLVMCGDARYRWEHHIPGRTTDTVNGKVIPRSTRISLTLRTALTSSPTASLPSSCDSYSDTIKPVFGQPLPRIERSYYSTSTSNEDSFNPSNCYHSLLVPNQQQDNMFSLTSTNGIIDSFITPATERTHVHNVYDAIAIQWNHTRGKRNVIWPGATNFIQSLPPGSVIADVGCGDGKYFDTCRNAGHFVIGTDISIPLLQTTSFSSRSSSSSSSAALKTDVVGADCIQMPFVSSRFDAILCIAVMHHLSTVERRKQCLREVRRLLVRNGIAMIQAWALEQEKDSRHSFGATDVLVPFNAQPRYLKPTATEEGTQVEADCEANNTNKVVDVAEAYANMYSGAQFDSEKGLVVFQRYCHVYRKGELDELLLSVGGWEIVESGYECGNHYVIAKAT